MEKTGFHLHMHRLLDKFQMKYAQTFLVHFLSVVLGVSLKERYVIFISVLVKSISCRTFFYVLFSAVHYTQFNQVAHKRRQMSGVFLFIPDLAGDKYENLTYLFHCFRELQNIWVIKMRNEKEELKGRKSFFFSLLKTVIIWVT